MDAVRLVPVGAPIDLLALHAGKPERYPFLLQSSSRDPALGRFDILFALPGETLCLDADGQLTGPFADGRTRFIDALDAWFAASGTSEHAGTVELPFVGGWFLFLAYELAGELEPSLSFQRDRDLPLAFATRCRAAVVVDHADGRCWIAGDADLGDAEIDAIRADAESTDWSRQAVSLSSIDEETPAVFIDAVRTAKAHIAAGDIYQANLSRAWHARIAAASDPASLYAALCAANPAPFAGSVRFGDLSIVSSSPERLLSIRDGIASTRPIAGTRPRSDDADIDGGLSAELIAHPKERAEHVMLIDLERNDLGRICLPGSVHVDEMMVIESYAHVHHIVSNVRGELRPEVTPGMAIRSVFPGGTITGCPKVRCMEIVSALEQSPRGAYTGSFGYLNRDGSMDLNILIRTIVQHGTDLRLRAGAGIVADSIPEAELEETRAKAKGLLRAIGA